MRRQVRRQFLEVRIPTRLPNIGRRSFLWFAVALMPFCVLWCPSAGAADAVTDAESAAERGYRLLRTKAYLPADFDQEVFDALWKVWPEPQRSEAEAATPAERRAMAFRRYGLVEPPEPGELNRPALGYVPKGSGWVMNCLSCHGGQVAGKVIPGLPNSRLALETLTEEVRLTKLALKKPLTHLDLGSLKMPLGTTVGTTNSVMFGVVLESHRNLDMTVDLTKPTPELMHHDMDPPAFWNVRKKKSLYCDGFSPKNHRALMQFILIPQNGRPVLDAWEQDFRDLLAWIESVQPPKYPFPIDEPLARQGETAFRTHCSRCHGTYGPEGRYEQKTIAIEEVGTDPVRLKSLSRPHREWVKASWLSHEGQDEVDLAPAGYVAPPLDGIWATAPYFHNGSTPTLWHVLHPDERPVVWTRKSDDGYDQERVGLEIESLRKVPARAKFPADRRRYFETTKFGKSAAGHRFPDALNEAEKRAVLEYLKSL